MQTNKISDRLFAGPNEKSYSLPGITTLNGAVHTRPEAISALSERRAEGGVRLSLSGPEQLAIR